MAKYLLDTTVLIDILRGRESVLQPLEALGSEGGHRFGVCAVNVAEVFSGMLEQERPATERLLASLLLWAIPYNAARMAGEVRGRLRREGKTISVTDAIVGAVAVTTDATLLTANVKDFPFPDLRIERLPSAR